VKNRSCFACCLTPYLYIFLNNSAAAHCCKQLFELQIEFILSEAAKCTQDEKHLAVALEFTRWELADAEKELRLLKSVASSSEKEYDQIQKDIEAIEKELDSERFVSLLVVRSSLNPGHIFK
jgi:hypothetical protein